MGSIVPASGAGGLALGAWILRRGGMPGGADRAPLGCVLPAQEPGELGRGVVIGALFAVGILGPHQPLWRTALPAVLALGVIVAVVAIGSLRSRGPRPADAERAARCVDRRRAGRSWAGCARRWSWRAGERRRAGRDVRLLGVRQPVLWATFHAVGASPPLSVILLGYLIGQLGGALPIPGGVGGIDLGLVGTLIVYGTPAQATVAAVLAYRLILFWLPLIGGALAFWSLRRWLNRPERPDLCVPAVRCVVFSHGRAAATRR